MAVGAGESEPVSPAGIPELWDSIADDDEALALTSEQREDLERRLAEADADPTGGSPWEEVRERIRHRSR